jgi:iron complex transport system permease protein
MGSTWDEIAALAPWLVVFVPLALLLARHVDALHLGEDVARGLGMRVAWQRGVLLLTSVALVAAAVATAGTIGFVGLIAPHIARRLVGATYTGLKPVAALVGGLLVVLADLVGRTIVAPTEIPCGVVIAIIGAPFFLYLLYRRQTA